MSRYRVSFLAYLIATFGTIDVFYPPEVASRSDIRKDVKKESKRIMHHIRTQNKNRMLRSAHNKVRYHV